MTKYNPKEKEPLIIKSVRIELRHVTEVANIHNNFSEFVRDALDEKLIKEQSRSN